ncbi:DNA mismatch repair protein mutL [uncultured Roseburia sp.]|uniref:DNA mismatch repair protein MutL n=1 Tax=Brotonthovivens ammoniilytica TaxID=2981725 RepID=A0ABT2TGD7_9FIRM|nr:DNA mismatch repair endonuclease MutL [Brotonthovivens ammoniilytica]MCU6761217.1 DNA mismatch repair endonuclease MutL [Brotonthovivens ammoniilytica]SCI22207.1 DNA mismatch repair protein mutL [uncultured Roseburia sp.]
MPQITLLDKNTIDKIAAGEVVDRPASVVKELVENAVDAKATAVTVEIKEGGISFIRITDNGCGIEKDQIQLAFCRHSTSKIRSVEDLVTISSLGFRGEALSSIASVAQVELITKTSGELTGCRYLIEGGEEKELEDIGAPNGTTFLVKNLFYNTPARRKFLKTASTEAGYISDLMERLALSNPEVSFKFINNGQVKLHTSGNSNLKDIIYHVYGRDIAANLLPIEKEFGSFSVSGFIGKPVISRGNRNFENYFVNGRYVKSSLLAKTIEDAYKGFMMQHKYPFTVLKLSLKGELVDVNVHPAKMELRFSNGEEIYRHLASEIKQVLRGRELIPQVSLQEEEKKEEKIIKKAIPEPFEVQRIEQLRRSVAKDSPYEKKYDRKQERPKLPPLPDETEFPKESSSRSVYQSVLEQQKNSFGNVLKETSSLNQKEAAENERTVECIWTDKQEIKKTDGTSDAGLSTKAEKKADPQAEREGTDSAKQETTQLEMKDLLPKTDKLLDQTAVPYHKIIGQLFDTYWLVEFRDQLYMIDQHAAHEKVLFERTMKAYQDKEFTSQYISPPIILSLTMQEEILLKKFLPQFEKLGFEIEPFGGREYAVRAVPGNLYNLDGQELVVEIMDGLSQITAEEAPEQVLEKVATMSCKAAVKGNQRLSKAEIETLIGELLTLENPYHCPHGRPVIVSMSKYEIEKKFKRII